MRAEFAEKPLLSAVCPWCGSAEPPFAGGFCPGCHQSREVVDRTYCELHGGGGDAATLVIAPTLVIARTLVAHGGLCPSCGFSFDAVPAVVTAPACRRRRWRARSLVVALGTVAAAGLLLFGAERTGDTAVPPASAVSTPVALTPRAAISRAYGYDVGPCLLFYRGETGDTYACGEGDVATIGPGGAVRLPSLWP